MVRAMFAFSADPITYGHIDIISRAAKQCDELIVGIGINPAKKYLFSLEERTDMSNRFLSGIPNVKLVSYRGLLVDYAYEHKIPVVFKGVRNAADFDYENLLHQIGESQKKGIETLLLLAKPELSHVSSSAAKAVLKEQGLIHEFVPLYVKQCLEAKMLGQYIVGITGSVGVGKSYVGRKFEEFGKEKKIPVHNMDLDKIGHKVLGELTEESYVGAREEIVDEFGEGVRQADGFINRKALGEIVFNDNEKLKKLNKIIHEPIMVRLRREIYGEKGMILLNAALIAETGISYLCNNNVVLVDADKKSQERRLNERGLTPEQINRRLASQYDTEEKRRRLEKQIDEDSCGKLGFVDNSDDSDPNEIEIMFDAIVDELGIKCEKD